MVGGGVPGGVRGEQGVKLGRGSVAVSDEAVSFTLVEPVEVLDEVLEVGVPLVGVDGGQPAANGLLGVG